MKRSTTGVKEPKLFTEFDKEKRDRIAEVVEEKAKKQTILSPIVEDYVYATTRALDVGDYYGTLDKRALWQHAVNRNADYFDITEMEEVNPDYGYQRYLSFRKASMYQNHNSKDPSNAIGLVFDSYLMKDPYDDMKVIALFGIDSKRSPSIARALQTYPERNYVSMGCQIKSSVCTICGKEIKTDFDFCDHLKYARGQRVGGKYAAELLRGVDFYELSMVNTPAAPKAIVIDAITEILPGRLLKVASNMKEGQEIIQVMASVHRMIRDAQSHEEKRRLTNNFDKLITKLEALV